MENEVLIKYKNYHWKKITEKTIIEADIVGLFLFFVMFYTQLLVGNIYLPSLNVFSKEENKESLVSQ